MSNANVRVNANESAGKVKKINGGTLAPPTALEKAGLNIRKEFQALNLPVTRLHDAPYENPGFRLVDVHQIFANFHADADDPRNYYFKQTDDYIKNCIELGTGVIYRLGASIEWGVNKYFTFPPEDYDKWIDICSHIIQHYTESWAKGFQFNIKYWEIWNEPEGVTPDGDKPNWGDSYEEYLTFYIKVATELKRRFPHLRFGGPSHTGYKAKTQQFLAACIKAQAPVDFYSWHSYGASIQENVSQVHIVKRWAIEAGYPDAELHLNEWHWTQTHPVPPGNWRANKVLSKLIYEGFPSLEAGVYSAALLTAWQDTPLDMSCFYTTTTNFANYYGIFDKYGIPTKCYYGLKAFGEIVRYGDRVKAESDSPNVYVLAGKNESGVAVLISSFRNGGGKITVELDFEPGGCELLALDEQHDLEPVRIVRSGNRIEVECLADSTVHLLKLNCWQKSPVDSDCEQVAQLSTASSEGASETVYHNPCG